MSEEEGSRAKEREVGTLRWEGKNTTDIPTVLSLVCC